MCDACAGDGCGGAWSGGALVSAPFPGIEARVQRAMRACLPATLSRQEVEFLLMVGTVRHAGGIVRGARALRAIAERDCNGYRDEASRTRDERAEAVHREVIDRAARAAGWWVSFGGDPRGAVVRLYRSAEDAKEDRNRVAGL